MTRPLLNLVALCTISLSIILFCVIAGGYSSFSRSQDRIKEASSFFIDACKKRMVLFNNLILLSQKDPVRVSEKPIQDTAQKAEVIFQQFISQAPLVDSHLIKEFEISQNQVLQQLIVLLQQLEATSGPTETKDITLLKKELNTVQDALFVAKKQYNSETSYFNARIQMFPGFLIAKLFGLNNTRYTGFSEDTFLSGEKTFTSPAS